MELRAAEFGEIGEFFHCLRARPVHLRVRLRPLYIHQEQFNYAFCFRSTAHQEGCLYGVAEGRHLDSRMPPYCGLLHQELHLQT